MALGGRWPTPEFAVGSCQRPRSVLPLSDSPLSAFIGRSSGESPPRTRVEFRLTCPTSTTTRRGSQERGFRLHQSPRVPAWRAVPLDSQERSERWRSHPRRFDAERRRGAAQHRGLLRTLAVVACVARGPAPSCRGRRTAPAERRNPTSSSSWPMTSASGTSAPTIAA